MECVNNNWIYTHDKYQWTLTPSSSFEYGIYIITNYGIIDDYGASDNFDDVYPVVYLKASVKIVSGDGSEDNPYQLSL